MRIKKQKKPKRKLFQTIFKCIWCIMINVSLMSLALMLFFNVNFVFFFFNVDHKICICLLCI